MHARSSPHAHNSAQRMPTRAVGRVCRVVEATTRHTGCSGQDWACAAIRTSKRSRSITLANAVAKSLANFSFASSAP